MSNENLKRIAATDVKQAIKNQIITIYDRENIPGLNGFKLTLEELCRDTEGLEEEILEIMNHPRKYKVIHNVIAYIRNAQSNLK